jgi:ribosomal protein S18 acetylase RimI-like enzyme
VKALQDQITIRPIHNSEHELLKDFLYYAVFIPPGAEPVPVDIIYEPGIFVYIKDFGKADDLCVVAVSGGVIVGAAWSRILAGPGQKGYGNIDKVTPELSISVFPEHRNKGTGTMLLESLHHLLRTCGYKRISLSVQKENPAFRLYQRTGYRITREGENGEDYIMVNMLGEETNAGECGEAH